LWLSDTRSRMTCPLCQKTVVDTAPLDREREMFLRMTQLPSLLRDQMVNVLCNDCLWKGTVPFHIEFKCESCGSFNTRRV
jgi:ribosomal protein S27E